MQEEQQSLAVVVRDVKKTFKLPHDNHSGVKQVLVNLAKHKKGYELQKVLNGVSFDIKKGEFFGIVGRNGSGKSTLLKLLAGIYVPDSGSVQMNGSLTPFIELGVGFNPELTGRENVFLNGALLGFSRTEMEQMYDDIVDFAELKDFMDQKLKNYSSGMQVRLAFSIATRADTDVLIFDEVLAVGDSRFQQKCLDIFRELKSRGKTIILVSHSTADIAKFCDRVLVIEKGDALGVFNADEAVALYESLNINASETDAKKVKKRWGSKLLVIDDISIQPEEAKLFNSLDVTLLIKPGKALDNDVKFVAGLGIYDKDKVNTAGPNSKDNEFVFKKDKSEMTVTFSIPRIVFNSGEYSLTAAILDEFGEKSYDHIVDAKKFHIISNKLFHGKLVLKDAKWSLR